MIPRRLFPELRVTAAAAITALVVAFGVTAADAQVYRGVVVDTAPLAARGASVSAAQLRAIIAPVVASQVRIAPRSNAPVLVVRVRNLSFAGYGGGGGRLGGMEPSDYLEGEVIVNGVARPLLATLPPSYSGAYYLPDIDRRRLVNIGQAFGQWAARYANGTS